MLTLTAGVKRVPIIVIVEETSRNSQRINKSTTVDKASGETAEVIFTEHRSRKFQSHIKFQNC